MINIDAIALFTIEIYNIYIIYLVNAINNGLFDSERSSGKMAIIQRRVRVLCTKAKEAIMCNLLLELSSKWFRWISARWCYFIAKATRL
jgi:hypothetical protein